MGDELAFLPSEIAKIPGDVTIKSLSEPVVGDTAARYDYIVVADRTSTKQWVPALLTRKQAAVYGSGVMHLGPLAYRYPRDQIRVFGEVGTRDPADCFPFCG